MMVKIPSQRNRNLNNKPFISIRIRPSTQDNTIFDGKLNALIYKLKSIRFVYKYHTIFF